MNRRLFIPTLFLVLMMIPGNVQASGENRRDDLSPLARSGKVFSRGIANVLGFPAELVSTARRETDMHPQLWPVTYVPRALTNLFQRGASLGMDIFVNPFFVAPFSSDISPMTEPMGLPDYPWQKEM